MRCLLSYNPFKKKLFLVGSVCAIAFLKCWTKNKWDLQKMRTNLSKRVPFYYFKALIKLVKDWRKELIRLVESCKLSYVSLKKKQWVRDYILKTNAKDIY